MSVRLFGEGGVNMREMKDSGVVSIGKISVDWEAVKIKYLVQIRKENGMFDPENDHYIGLENVQGYSNDLIETNTQYESSIQNVCYAGDIMFGKLRPYLAKVIIAPFDGYCTGEFLQFSNFKGYKKYLYYSLLNELFIDYVNASTYGAKMPRANTDFIINSYISYPPVEEQQSIATYLDRKCAEIDTLITDIETQIETLEQYKRSVITEAVTKGINPDAEMKDSGVRWIGQMPAHWEIKRIKHLFSLRTEKNHKPLEEVQLLSLYANIGVFPHGEREERGNKAVQAEGYNIVYKNDIVVNIILAWMGSIGISDYDGVTSPAYDVYKPSSSMTVPRFFHYVFRTQGIADECYRYGRGIMMMRWRTYSSEFKQIQIPVPSIEEQHAIADYLDRKCIEIDDIIADKQTQLDTLAEYKKSLIYEYVTGKKEVPV